MDVRVGLWRKLSAEELIFFFWISFFIWISSDEMDETGADYTEWSKPERKTPIQYTNTYIWNLERWQYPCDPVCKTAKKTDVYSGLLDSEGEGEGGMIWENGIVTCILSCKNRITSLCLMQDTACLGLVHGDDPERCYGEGGGRGFMFGNACKN